MNCLTADGQVFGRGSNVLGQLGQIANGGTLGEPRAVPKATTHDWNLLKTDGARIFASMGSSAVITTSGDLLY